MGMCAETINNVLENSILQNRKERPNRSPINGDINEKAKRSVCEWVNEGLSLWHLFNYKEVQWPLHIRDTYTKGMILG